MTREVRDIPPAPRRVRWRAVLWHWWPVAFFGFVGAVYGGLITLMLFLYSGGVPSEDYRLDRECVRAPGQVTEVYEARSDGWYKVFYDFTVLNRNGQGRYRTSGDAMLPGTTRVKLGDTIQIEYLYGEPNVSRALGGRRVVLPPLLTWFFFGMFLPGVLCMIVWLFEVVRLRRLMVHGDIAVADVTSIRRLPVVLPMTMVVDYQFRDHRAQIVLGKHWVRMRSELGMRLLENPGQVGVLHNRSGRGTSRLVMASDFTHGDTRAPVPQEAV